jgi:hypothetical protein
MVVHGNCLSRDSAFFKAALKREWGPDRAIRILEETPLLMGYYVEHLYGDPLPTHKLSSGPKVLDPEQPSYELLATLYVLGESVRPALSQQDHPGIPQTPAPRQHPFLAGSQGRQHHLSRNHGRVPRSSFDGRFRC